MITIGDDNLLVDKKTCEEVLRGLMTPYGCIVNSKNEPTFKEDDISIIPMGIKKYPVKVKKDKFLDLSTEAGKWSNVRTYLILP